MSSAAIATQQLAYISIKSACEQQHIVIDQQILQTRSQSDSIRNDISGLRQLLANATESRDTAHPQRYRKRIT